MFDKYALRRGNISIGLLTLMVLAVTGEDLYAASRLKGLEAERYLKSQYTSMIARGVSFAIIKPGDAPNEKFFGVIINPAGGSIKMIKRKEESLLVRLMPQGSGDVMTARDWKMIERLKNDKSLASHVILRKDKEVAAIFFLSSNMEYNYNIRDTKISLVIRPKFSDKSAHTYQGS